MLSIIICSVNDRYLRAIKDNISQTVGVPYQIVVVNNKENKYGLAKAYNIGAGSSCFDYICFLHEDIKFITQDWGNIVLSHLENLEVGLIGLAGGQYKSMVPSSWSLFPEFRTINIIQHYKYSKKATSDHVHDINERKANDNFADVIAIDGVFMATRKDIWDKCKFDEDLLRGFHGYDMDFSLQVFQQYKVRVIYDILMEHFSEGNQNKEWMENAIFISQKWRQFLPQGVGGVTKANQRDLHIRALYSFTNKLINLNYPFLVKNKLIFQYGFLYFPSAYTMKATVCACFIIIKAALSKGILNKLRSKI